MRPKIAKIHYLRVRKFKNAMILFYSDYLEGCHPEILRRLEETNYEQTPGYSKDSYCDKAKALIKDICQAPDADVHFLVGGTQTNATVIAATLRPFQGVLCANTGHINVHETGAIEHSGHKVLALPATNGKVSAETVRKALDAHFCQDSPEHEVQPGMLYISYPTELGTLYTKQELVELKAVCDEWEIPMFIDGARLGYGLASDACDLSIAELAAIADAFYIGGTKQGALFGEAVVIRKESMKADFRYAIKQGGGLLAKGRLLGIQFDALLRDGIYFGIARKADMLAMRIKEAFKAAGCEFLIDSPTNQQFPIITEDMGEKLTAAGIGFELWQKMDDGKIAVRFCTSWATRDEQVDALVSALEKIQAA